MKIYGFLWVLFAAVIGMIMLLGIFNGYAVVTSGMTAFGLIFFGMMMVIPYALTHKSEVLVTEQKAPRTLGLNALRERLTTHDIAVRELTYR